MKRIKCLSIVTLTLGFLMCFGQKTMAQSKTISTNGKLTKVENSNISVQHISLKTKQHALKPVGVIMDNKAKPTSKAVPKNIKIQSNSKVNFSKSTSPDTDRISELKTQGFSRKQTQVKIKN